MPKKKLTVLLQTRKRGVKACDAHIMKSLSVVPARGGGGFGRGGEKKDGSLRHVEKIGSIWNLAP